MNDVLPKPFPIEEGFAVIQKWMDEKLICMKTEGELQKQEEELPQIGDLDMAEAMRNCGSAAVFERCMGEFVRLLPGNCKKLQTLWEEENYRNFTIEVHGLKGLSRTIGAMELSVLAEELETFGNVLRDTSASPQVREKAQDAARQKFAQFLDKYRSYGQLKDVLFREENEKPMIEKELFSEEMQRMLHAAEIFNLDVMDKIIEKINQYALPPQLKGTWEELELAVMNIDIEEITKLIQVLLALQEKT
jgi:HPt (histidine-containing phosphotransfer) domain-containing protein